MKLRTQASWFVSPASLEPLYVWACTLCGHTRLWFDIHAALIRCPSCFAPVKKQPDRPQ